ncbi:hypothetical protein LCGC14_0505560 [marine sediment metagenome]|uniref:Uncharacterized protein n=1 Tax=marine sediment metagenome TaxID=412755 RepID=A0A0F9UPG5_9ZZZZ|nr:MAG: hypothetical protein Lokiarch_52930 [Candidatus Lokiarchaeum sp. GC14_75]
MNSLEAQLPDPTKIIFILDILKNNGRIDLQIDVSRVYNFVKDIGKNGIIFDYDEDDEYKIEDKLFNSVMNIDIVNLEKDEIIKRSNGDQLEFNSKAEKIVGDLKVKYKLDYEYIKKLIYENPIFNTLS